MTIKDRIINIKTIYNIFSEFPSLRLKFAIPVILIMAFILIVFEGLHYTYESVTTKQELKNKEQSIFNLAKMTIADPLWNFNEEGIKQASKAILKDNDIYFIEVRDYSDKVIYSESKKYLGNDLKGLDILKGEISKAGFQIGYLTIGITDYQVEQGLKSSMLFSLINLLLMIYIIWLVIFKISDIVIKPINELIETTQKISQGDFSKRITVKSKDEIASLTTNFNSMIDSIEYFLFKENMLREIITESKKLENHDEIYNYLLNQLSTIFNVSRSIHLHYNENKDLYVVNEVIKNKSLKPLLGEIILCNKDSKEFCNGSLDKIIIINNTNNELKDSKFKNLLINNNIQSFIIYSTTGKLPKEREEKLLGLTIICSENARTWTQNDTDYYKIVVSTISITYLELMQRKEIEETKQTFLATLTHDLRSPIVAIQKAIEFIITRKPETQLSEFQEYLNGIYNTNEELLRIVNNILSVYHYETGKVELKLKKCNIKDLISDSAQIMIHLAKEQESNILINIKEELPEIIIDKDEINRVIINLLSNAIKYNEKGTTIIISAKTIDNKIQVSVKDNGQGISEEEKPKIFQRYPTAKRKIGTGLGLFLSKQIIENHHGQIWFETEVGKGTTFYFSLPIIKADITD